MQINELEMKTGLDRATIRFYEKEGMITPIRKENGYRDYSEEDQQHLLKIKLLRSLQGRAHQVYTGVALALEGKTECFYDVTEVEFYPLSEEEIQWYASLEEPYDKAGGYGIQGKGSLLVKGIHGDYFNVMGFPVALCARKIRKYFDFTKTK